MTKNTQLYAFTNWQKKNLLAELPIIGTCYRSNDKEIRQQCLKNVTGMFAMFAGMYCFMDYKMPMMPPKDNLETTASMMGIMYAVVFINNITINVLFTLGQKTYCCCLNNPEDPTVTQTLNSPTASVS